MFAKKREPCNCYPSIILVKLGRVSLKSQRVLRSSSAQQSVHPTLGILARFQAFFYASTFFQLDGVPPPAPARVTQTVGRLSLTFHKLGIIRNYVLWEIVDER